MAEPIAAFALLLVLCIGCLGGTVETSVPAAAAVPSPASFSLRSAVSNAGGAWVVVPMGELGDESNTFWQLVHAAVGSSHWSVVTPEGVADNGGIVAGVSSASADVAILPSGLLRFSPLARSTDAGRTWSPAFLPGALAARPDALAASPAEDGPALAVVGRSILSAPAGLSSWSRSTSVSALAAAWPGCGPTAIDAVAVAPDGDSLAATDCRRGGRVGIFTHTKALWSPSDAMLGGRLRRSSTEVLRLETTGSNETAVVLATDGARRSVAVLWSLPDGRWDQSAPLALTNGSTVVSTAVNASGAVAALVSEAGGLVPFTTTPGSRWSRLPPPPHGSVAVAVGTTGAGASETGFDAFEVSGTLLRVYTTNPAGTAWMAVQSIRVPLAYGSSS